MKVRFLHRICRTCGMAWKETAEHPTSGMRVTSSCPRCGLFIPSHDVVKVSEEEYE